LLADTVEPGEGTLVKQADIASCQDLAAQLASRTLSQVAALNMLLSCTSLVALRDITTDADHSTLHLFAKNVIVLEQLRPRSAINASGKSSGALPNPQVLEPRYP